jgi:hypothetical protein
MAPAVASVADPGFNEDVLATDSSDDEREHSRRCTEHGINVVALDRNGRGLFRARPEHRLRSARFPIAPPLSTRSLLPSLFVVALMLAVVVLVTNRLVA